VLEETANEVALEVLEVAHPPNNPTPRISQTTELTTDVTVAAGALGTAEETWARIELATDVAAADETMADAGSPETTELTADTMGAKLAAADALLDKRDDVAALDEEVEVVQSPSSPMPNTLQTTELTTEVTVAAGASGTAELTWARIEVAAADEATAVAGSPEMAEFTAETMGAKLAEVDERLDEAARRAELALAAEAEDLELAAKAELTLATEAELALATEAELALATDAALALATDAALAMATDAELALATEAELALATDAELALATDAELALATEAELALATDAELALATDAELALATEAELALAIDAELALAIDAELALATDAELALATDAELALATEAKLALTTDAELALATDAELALATDAELALATEAELALAAEAEFALAETATLVDVGQLLKRPIPRTLQTTESTAFVTVATAAELEEVVVEDRLEDREELELPTTTVEKPEPGVELELLEAATRELELLTAAMGATLETNEVDATRELETDTAAHTP